MKDVLMDASREWATRPDDQRFGSLQEMYFQMFMTSQQSQAQDISHSSLRVRVGENGDLVLDTPVGEVDFTHWSFGQLAQRIGAPASWLRTLKPELVTRNFNAGLERTVLEDAQMYYRNIPGRERPKLSAITSTRYGRIYNHDILHELLSLPGNWVSPLSMPKNGEATRPATEEDVRYGTNLTVGEPVSLKRALYGSDKDMFAFLVNPDYRIDDGSDGGLGRGFFISNSEVGDATFSITDFRYRFICRNNIVWGASDVQKISVKHLGRGAKGRAFDQLAIRVKEYLQSSATEDEARIRRAKSLVLGEDLKAVQDRLYRDEKVLSKRIITDAYELATIHEQTDGEPNSAWGFVNGLTRLSQQTTYTDERVQLDRAAGKILAMAD